MNSPTERGVKAAREFEELSAAFDKVRADLLESIANTKLGEQDARERIYLAVQTMDAVKAALIGVANNAALADHEANISKVMNG